MKKGDLRKQQFIQTAEELFCRKGYEQTSIQDILDQLNASKGSFYHYFISKEALLETICSQRAEHSFANLFTDSGKDQPAQEKLNMLLSALIPFHDEKLTFILMLLPVFNLPEGKSLKASYCDALGACFHSAVRDAIDEGVRSGEMFCEDAEIYADIVISLTNCLWVSLCDIIIRNETTRTGTDLSELLHMTEQYRKSVEKLLSISYGTIVLIDIPLLKGLMDQIHLRWNSNQTDYFI